MKLIKPISEESRLVQSKITAHQKRRNKLGRKQFDLKAKLDKTKNPFMMWWHGWKIAGLDQKLLKSK